MRVKAWTGSEAQCIHEARVMHDRGEKRGWLCIVLDDDMVDFRPQWDDRPRGVQILGKHRHE